MYEIIYSKRTVFIKNRFLVKTQLVNKLIFH